jgi:hypothetical protein
MDRVDAIRALVLAVLTEAIFNTLASSMLMSAMPQTVARKPT